jgi:FixJ family two-component response regulator
MNFEDFKGHIYLIDDDPSIRRSLAFSLSSLRYSIQSFENPKAFLRDSLPISPAVILLDNRMPETSGLSLQNELIRQGRGTPIIFISGESQPAEIIEAMKKGAVDFLLKPFGLHVLVQSIDLALEKDKKNFAQKMKTDKARQRFSSLTDKECEIFGWMIKGFGNKEIANLNGSAASTVKLHRSRVLEKMGCTSLSELLDLAMDGDRRILNIFEQTRSAKTYGLTGQRRMANTDSADIIDKPTC